MELLNRFGHAMALAALVLSVMTAAVLFALLLAGRAFFFGKRESGAVSVRGSLRQLFLAILMCAGQTFLLLLFGRLIDWPTDNPAGLEFLGLFANATVAVPVGALAFTLARLLGAGWPQSRRVMYGIAALITVLAALAGAAQIYRFRQYDKLPSAIVELAGTSYNGCARLANGQVACFGLNQEGQRGHGYSPDADRPTLVRGLSDATRIYYGGTVACALRQHGPPVCWGGCETLHPRPSCLSPWPLHEGAGATMLAVISSEIAGMRADGSTFGWPHPLPPEFSRVRKISGHPILFDPAICSIDQDGIAACFLVPNKKPAKPVRRLLQLGEVTDVAQVKYDQICVVRKDGRLSCVNDQNVTRDSPISDVEQITVMLDGWDWWSCATRKDNALACWNGLAAPRTLAELAGPHDGVFAHSPQICAKKSDGIHCAIIGDAKMMPARSLLSFQ